MYLILILDLTVPRDIGGFQTLQKLKNQFPDLKAVATSGFSEDPIIANPLKYGFVDAIRKPYHKTNWKLFFGNI